MLVLGVTPAVFIYFLGLKGDGPQISNIPMTKLRYHIGELGRIHVSTRIGNANYSRLLGCSLPKRIVWQLGVFRKRATPT